MHSTFSSGPSGPARSKVPESPWTTFSPAFLLAKHTPVQVVQGNSRLINRYRYDIRICMHARVYAYVRRSSAKSLDHLDHFQATSVFIAQMPFAPWDHLPCSWTTCRAVGPAQRRTALVMKESEEWEV